MEPENTDCDLEAKYRRSEFLIKAYLASNGMKSEDSEIPILSAREVVYRPPIRQFVISPRTFDLSPEHRARIPENVEKFACHPTWACEIITTQNNYTPDDVRIYSLWAEFKNSLSQIAGQGKARRVRKLGAIAKFWKSTHIELVLILDKKEAELCGVEHLERCPEVYEIYEAPFASGFSIIAIKIRGIPRDTPIPPESEYEDEEDDIWQTISLE